MRVHGELGGMLGHAESPKQSVAYEPLLSACYTLLQRVDEFAYLTRNN